MLIPLQGFECEVVAAPGSSQSFSVVAVGGEESRAGSRLLFSALDSYLRGVTATIRGVLVSHWAAGASKLC
jgi:hypothetical protein